MEQTARTRENIRAENARRQTRDRFGRWTTEETRRRGRRVSVRLTEDEYQAAAEQAAQLGVTVTDMLRGLLIDGYSPIA